jgi:hypothetical protein
VPRIRIAFDPVLVCANAFGGAVAARVAFRRWAIDLNEHRVINIGTKRILNGFKISLVAVRCNLDAIAKAARQIGHEGQGGFGTSIANAP